MTSGASAVAGKASSADEAAAVLRVFRDSQVAARHEEMRQIALAVKFATLHEVEDFDAAATSGDEIPAGEERALLLGGDGSPWISEFCVVDFAAATGRSTQAARAFLGTSLALVHRFPRTWAAVRSGVVDGWRGRRIAEATMTLPSEAATWIDGQVASRAQRVGVRTLDRLVAEAVARFDPEQHAQDELDDLGRRHVTLYPSGTGRAATSDVTMRLDAPDALDLDRVLDELADHLLAVEGAVDSKEVRRARAVGMLARGEVTFTAAAPRDDDVPRIHVDPRTIDLRVWVIEGDTLATVHSLTGQHLGMVTIDRLQAWCRAARVVVTPVLDLAEGATAGGRFATGRMRERVTATARYCAFPYCERPAEACDLDHIEAWVDGGPPHQTRSGNLAPLCRLHHRIKTFTDWQYHQGLPGLYYWRSPTGDTYIVDRDGTEAVRSDRARAPAA